MELWEPKRRIEAAFRHSLLDIAGQVIARVGDNPSPFILQRTLRILSSSPDFSRWAEAAAMNMVTHLFDDQGRTWRQAAAANGRGRDFYDLLQRELRTHAGRLFMEQVQRNAAIIKTLPGDIADDVTKYIARESMRGRRASDIAQEIIFRFPEQTRARAKLIARTEVSKTQSAITESRCREYGVNWYVWRAVGGNTGDGRTRSSHRRMSGVLINWNDPPAPEDLFPLLGKHGQRYRSNLGNYHAGNCPNCRCYAEPVISLE